MATITYSVGTSGRDYSTIAAAIAAIPSDVVASGNSYVLELYNDSEFTENITLGYWTTNSTHTVTVKCGPGQSFYDHADKDTNRLWYDQTKGVGINAPTTGSGNAISTGSPYTTIDGLQIKKGSSSDVVYMTTFNAAYCVMKNCIIIGTPAAGGFNFLLNGAGDNSTFINNLFVMNTGNNTNAIGLQSAAGSTAFVNNTVVRPSNFTAIGSAIRNLYGTIIVRNCMLFGFTGSSNGGTFDTDGHNCTEKSNGTPGTTGNLLSKTYANQFEQTSSASVPDFRLKAGSDAINAGVTDTTNIPDSKDIIKKARS